MGDNFRLFGCKTQSPLSFSVCGQLLSPSGFLHHRRTYEYHVLIMVTEGTLYITSNEVPYTLHAGQYIFLRAGEEHFGHRASSGKLSYSWVHFKGDMDFEPLPTSDQVSASEDAGILPPSSYSYLFPECATLYSAGRCAQLFHQLMDLSLEEHLYAKEMPDYALSLLLMELTQQYLQAEENPADKLPSVVQTSMEWIKNHYFLPFTVTELADAVGYQPDYLSSLFKKSTGVSLVSYTNEIRVRNAKALLTNYDVAIKEAAYSCGFTDEKYFMKVFKKAVGMTPTQYKTAFYKKSFNI